MPLPSFPELLCVALLCAMALTYPAQTPTQVEEDAEELSERV
jgi:hypothetical protein